MRYYVVADPHGFFTELKTTLEEKEFFTDDQPHKLIICGDLFDRGAEARELQAFILDLMEQGEVILIRGNHEDLLLDFLYSLPWSRHISPHHISNGTVDTVCQLTGTTEELLFASRFSVGKEMLDGPLVQRIIPAMVDYYETEHNIFVHGWIPCLRYQLSPYKAEYNPVPDWRNADEKMWSQARWTNGMEAAHSGVIECGKPSFADTGIAPLATPTMKAREVNLIRMPISRLTMQMVSSPLTPALRSPKRSIAS